MQDILKSLGIDETFQKQVRKPETPFNTVKTQIPNKEDYNFMSDVLHLPTDKNGFRYCLVLVDLATDDFDIEPMKELDPDETLSAMKKMFTRKFIKKPYSSIRTDGGVEFKGAFDKYCYDNSIMHTVGVRGRHQQQANVESLNRQLSRLFNGYMNSIEVKTGKTYRNWTDVITDVRTDLNKLRKKVLIKDSITALPQEPLNLIKKKITKTKDKKGKITEKITYVDNKPKYKMGDIVYRKLDHVEDAIGNKQPTEKARMGDIRWDRQPRKIEQVFTYDGENTYRYQITGLKNVSYSEWELMPAKEETELFEVRKILNKKKVGNKYEYLTWYWGELKKEASWQPEAELLKYVPKLIQEYNENPKKK